MHLFRFYVSLMGLLSSAQGQVLNDREMWFDRRPLMIPLRGIFEALQAEVLQEDSRTRAIKATRGSTIVELALGSRVGTFFPPHSEVRLRSPGSRSQVERCSRFRSQLKGPLIAAGFGAPALLTSFRVLR